MGGAGHGRACRLVPGRKQGAVLDLAARSITPLSAGGDVMRFNRRELTQASLAALLAGCANPSGGSGDVILHGGPIYTGVASAPRVEAVRIRGQRIVFVGALSEARSG